MAQQIYIDVDRGDEEVQMHEQTSAMRQALAQAGIAAPQVSDVQELPDGRYSFMMVEETLLPVHHGPTMRVLRPHSGMPMPAPLAGRVYPVPRRRSGVVYRSGGQIVRYGGQGYPDHRW